MLTKAQQLTTTCITFDSVYHDRLGDFINEIEAIPQPLRRTLADLFDDLVDRLTEVEAAQDSAIEELAELQTTLDAIREAGGW